MKVKHSLFWRDGSRYIQCLQTGDTYTYEQWRTKQAELIAELKAQNDAFFNSPDQVERREYLER
jgi:phosphosulfolactate phosphohydrolase-like enzyme